MKKILVIDDDSDVLALVKHTLSREFDVTFAEEISLGEGLIVREEFDLIILDEVLPDGLGSELCQRIKNTSGKESLPVIMLTQRKELKDKLNAFDAGADDYISKPFEPLELLARVHARLRVAGNAGSNVLEREDLKLELTSQALHLVKNGLEEEVLLTPIEFKLLYQLAKDEGVVKSRGDLLEAVWGKNQNVIDRTVDQHISKLRKKIEGSKMTVKSLHKKGYLLASND
jgi:DNA-binding response OmpR family regulator